MKKEVLQYWSELINGNMSLDKPLWEFHVIEDYTKDTSMVLARFHHSFTDGIGFISLMSWLNDNKYNIKNTKVIPKLSLVQNILLTLAIPYYLYKVQSNSSSISTDIKAAKIQELKENGDSYVNLYASKTFDFESIKKWYKRFSNTTFNDYSLGIISTSLHKWFKESGVDGAEGLKMMFPINLRSLPTCIDELILDNWLTTFNYLIPITDNLEESIKESKARLKKTIKPEYVLASDKWGILFKNFPNQFLRKGIVEESLKNLDLSFSNLPYSSDPLYFLSKLQLSLCPFANMFKGLNWMLVGITYKGQLRFTMMARRSMVLDGQRFLSIIEQSLTDEIAQFARRD